MYKLKIRKLKTKSKTVLVVSGVILFFVLSLAFSNFFF